MAKPRIVIELCPNIDVRVYNVSTQISRHTIADFNAPLPDYEELYLSEEVGSPGMELVKEVLAVLGVEKVYIKPYNISVYKGKSFDWEDIEPSVITSLRKILASIERFKEIVGEKAENTIEITTFYHDGRLPDIKETQLFQ